MEKGLNRHFSPKKIYMVNRYMKRYSTSLIMEVQIKTTRRYHLTLVRMIVIKKRESERDKCWQGCREKGILVPCWWECKLVQPLWKTLWMFLKKLKTELPYNPAIQLLCIYLEKMNSLSQRDICTYMFIAALFKIAKT